jgi:hypothetical protein
MSLGFCQVTGFGTPIAEHWPEAQLGCRNNA